MLCGDKTGHRGNTHDGGDGSETAADHFGRWGSEGEALASGNDEASKRLRQASQSQAAAAGRV